VTFRGLNSSRNADIGQIGHLWMGNTYAFKKPERVQCLSLSQKRSCGKDLLDIERLGV
jgi:hypothetical protein